MFCPFFETHAISLFKHVAWPDLQVGIGNDPSDWDVAQKARAADVVVFVLFVTLLNAVDDATMPLPVLFVVSNSLKFLELVLALI